MSNLIDIANTIDVLISQGRLKEKDSVEKAYILVETNKQEFNLDFEFDINDVKTVLRNKKKYRLDDTFERYKDVEPSDEFKEEEEVFKKKQEETKQIFKILYKLKKNKEIDITTDSAKKVYNLISPLISTSMDKKEVKEIIYEWAELVSSKEQEEEDETEEDEKKIEKKAEKALKKSAKMKLEKDEKPVDYDTESLMKNINNIRRFADVSLKITLMKFVSNEDRKFYIDYKKKMEEDKKKLSLLGSSVQRDIRQVEEIQKKKRGKKVEKKVEKEVEKEVEKDDYMKLLGEQEEEKKPQKKIIRKQMKIIKSDTDKADEYFTWYLENTETTMPERINKVNESGLILLNKMEYFLKLPDNLQLFYAKSFKRAKEDSSFNFYNNLSKYVKTVLGRIELNQRISKKKDISKYDEFLIKNLERDTKNILEKNKEFEEYTSKVENTVLNSIEEQLKTLSQQLPPPEEAPRVEKQKVTEKDLEEHDDDDFLVELFTPQGTYFVWYSTIKQKSEKEGKKEEKKELGKFYDLKYQINNVISTRSPADLLSITKENNKGFLYSSWAVNNQDATTADHLNKITSLGLSPSLVGPLLRLDNETRNLFYYSIISKFADQEDKNAIYTWTFYGVLAEFLRNTGKKVYIEKLRASVQDMERLQEITAQEIELLGEDIEDLFEKEEKNTIDDEDSVDDDVENLQDNIDRTRFDIRSLVSEFLEEKTEYNPKQNTELNFMSISFLKWLYNNYPSAPQFNAAEIRDVFKDSLGKERLFIGVKTLVSKTGEKRQLKIPFVKDIMITEVLNTDETELVSKARSFINLATTYDSKSKLYMAFHMEAYKLSNEEELDETISKYNERFRAILKESLSEDFLKEYKNLWKKYNLKIKSSKDIPKVTLEKLMNLTPYVQKFLKSKTKLLKNPLIINTNRRNNRKRILNSKESIASRLLSKLPSNISSTVKECLLWNQTKPYWNLNYKQDIILIAQADGVTKEQMPENMKIFFGDFVHLHHIEGNPYYFYKPSRMYSLLQCHLTYNEKDIVQCRANIDNSITLYTENLSLNIFTGIYNTMARVTDNEDVSLDDKYDRVSNTNSKKFSLVTKSMYDKECKWWQDKTSSPSVIINKLKQLKLDSEEREVIYIVKQIENNVEILLRNIVNEKDVDKVTKYVMNHLTRNKDKNVSKLVYEFVLIIFTISNIFYPGKIIKNYKTLWKLTPDKLTQESIDDLLSIPDEYKFIEIYSHPEPEKREVLKQIFLDEISREVDNQIAYFYNSYYKDRPKIRAVSGRRIGYVSNSDPISIKLGKKLKTIQKGLLFDDDVNCYNDLDDSYKGTYVKVRGIIMNEEGEEEDKIICIRINKIYDLYENNKNEEYYNTRIKLDDQEYADVVIPRQVVNTVFAQVSLFDPLMYLKKDLSEYIIYNGEFYNKNNLPDYVCLNQYKGDKNRIIFVKVLVKTPDGKEEEEKMVCMDIMKIYELYQENYNKSFYETIEMISPDVSLAIKIPRETVNTIKTHVDDNKNKYSFDSGYRFDNVKDINLFCTYCNKVIESDDNVLKSYEQHIDNKEVITSLMLYCSTDCFNNYNEKIPKLKEKYSHKHNMDQDIKKRMHLNFMIKSLHENKIPSNRLTYFGYTSTDDLKYDILNGKISLPQFVSIMGEKQMEKYNNVLYYLR